MAHRHPYRTSPGDFSERDLKVVLLGPGIKDILDGDGDMDEGSTFPRQEFLEGYGHPFLGANHSESFDPSNLSVKTMVEWKSKF